MALPFATRLPHRSALRIRGADRRTFLQALVSNDVAKVTTSDAIYAALLTPQGKFLHDMFVFEHDDAFLIDCEAERADDLLHRFSAYKLRSQITLENAATAFNIWAVWNGSYENPLSYTDPRLAKLGSRVFNVKGDTPQSTQPADFAAYDSVRMTLGVADGSRDLQIDKSTLAEANFDYLHGVDWGKGCYIGQELTARMHYRRLGKKHLFPVRLSGNPGEYKTLFFRGEEAGELRSHNGARGLALITNEAVHLSITQKLPLNCGDFGVSPFYPEWLIADRM
jgi:folate-binding protein YgfZ